MSEPQPKSAASHDNRDEYDFIFSNYYQKKVNLPANIGWQPLADLLETEHEIVITVDIAGVDKDRITISMHNKTLYLRGYRMERSGYDHPNFHLMEISYGPFERVFELPAAVVANSEQAVYVNGILEVRLQKQPPQAPSSVTISIN